MLSALIAAAALSGGGAASTASAAALPTMVAAASGTTAAPSTVTAAAPADGTYTYSIQHSGTEIGRSTLTFKRTDLGLSLHETETLAGGYSFLVDEVLDGATLSPRAFVVTYTQGGDQTVTRVAFDRSGATVTIDGVPGTASLPNPKGITSAYVIEGALMTGFAALPAELRASQASQFSMIAPRAVLQYTCSVDPHPAGSPPSGVPATDKLLVVSGPVTLEEWYDPATMVLHNLSVPAQQVVITLVR